MIRGLAAGHAVEIDGLGFFYPTESESSDSNPAANPESSLRT